MTITIADGRGALWQWDTGRRVKITDGDGVKQVHYQNKCFGHSVDVDVGDDGTAIIPDELLQDYHTLTAYAYVTDDAGGYTKVQVDFAVHKRARPSDYTYTPTEHAGFDRLRAEIGDLSALQTTAKDNLVAAINEAARAGGVERDHSKLINRDAQDQHPIGAIAGLADALAGKQPKGDYLTADKLQSATDAALAQAKASGVFDGAPGKDGVSPTVSTAATTGGTKVTITDAKGSHEFVVKDGAKGADGSNGKDGTNGEDGKPGATGADGVTPHIGDNGHWYIGSTDTGVAAKGVKGDTGPTGPAGSDASVTAANIAAALGYTPVKPSDVPTVPEALKNPNALTIKIGSTTVTYDGSDAKTVEIADGTEVAY